MDCSKSRFTMLASSVFGMSTNIWIESCWKEILQLNLLLIAPLSNIQQEYQSKFRNPLFLKLFLEVTFQ